MNIIIVGCGKVGQALAEQLNEEGNNITVIDVNAKKVSDLSTSLDIMGVTGNGATHAVQAEAGIDKADLLIAVTDSDELNLLCCLIARKSGHCRTIARVKDPEYNTDVPFLKDELGLAMVINPEQAAAAEIARVLRFPSAIKIDTFAKGRVELLKYRLPEGSPLVGMAVRDVVAKLKCDVLVCTVERGDEAFITNGTFVFAEKDVISLVASPRGAADFFKKIGMTVRSVKDVTIVGGTETAQYLTSILRRNNIPVKIIDRNKTLCGELCERFPDVSVICGDASDQSLLYEEGIAQAGAFVVLTDQDEENILLSLFAKRASRAKVVTKINRTDFSDVVTHLDLDSTIYPKNITAEQIVRYVRATQNTQGLAVETLYHIIQGKVEAAEFIVSEESDVTGVPLKDLRLKEGVLIAAIIRKGNAFIPRGTDSIQVGDALVIVSRPLPIRSLSDLLR